MMLPADLALADDKEFRKYVEIYAKDREIFFADFSRAFGKLMELGVKFPETKSPSSSIPSAAPISKQDKDGKPKTMWQRIFG